MFQALLVFLKAGMLHKTQLKQSFNTEMLCCNNFIEDMGKY